MCIEQHPDLSPGPGKVLVAVEAVGMNYADRLTQLFELTKGDGDTALTSASG